MLVYRAPTTSPTKARAALFSQVIVPSMRTVKTGRGRRSRAATSSAGRAGMRRPSHAGGAESSGVANTDGAGHAACDEEQRDDEHRRMEAVRCQMACAARRGDTDARDRDEAGDARDCVVDA